MPLDDLNATKDFTLSKVGEGAHYGLYKWCKIFGVMTTRCTSPKPKYIEAVRGAFTVETRDSESGAGGPHSESSGPALFGRRGLVMRSIRYCHSIIAKIPPFLEKTRTMLEQMSCGCACGLAVGWAIPLYGAEASALRLRLSVGTRRAGLSARTPAPQRARVCARSRACSGRSRGPASWPCSAARGARLEPRPGWPRRAGPRTGRWAHGRKPAARGGRAATTRARARRPGGVWARRAV